MFYRAKITRPRKINLPIFFFFVPALSLAAPPPLSLRDAILLALRYNPSVQNAEIQRVLDKFNLRLAQNQYEVNYALTGAANYTNTTQNSAHSITGAYTLTPTATLGASPYGASIQLSAPNTINHDYGSNAYYNPGVNVQVTQPLLRGFGRSINMIPLYNAQDTELLNQLNLKNVVVATITQVIGQYTALAQAENSLQTQKIALQNSIATRDQYAALIKAGRNAPADLVQFRADVASQQLTLAQQQLTVQQQKLALLTALGLDPNTAITIFSNFSLPAITLPTLDESIKTALANNIAYRTQVINSRILERDYRNAQNQQRWQLNLTGNAGVGGGSGGRPNSGLSSLVNGANDNRQIGLQLSIPIDDLNRKQQEFSAKNALDQAKINLSAARRQVISDVTNAYHNLLSQKRQIQQAQLATQLATENLQIAHVRAKYGRISPFEVSSQQIALTNAQLMLISTQESYLNSLASFDQIIGLTLQRWHIKIRD